MATANVSQSDIRFEIPFIDDTPPLTMEDEECMIELGEVLKKHGRLHRFGINLLHLHFPIEDGETLLETCDPATRTLTIKPVKRADLLNQLMRPTNWILGEKEGEVVMYCKQWCTAEKDGTHTLHHVDVV
jgi:hypothetical protein